MRSSVWARSCTDASAEGAVRRRPDGFAVRVVDPALGAVWSVAVETGATTLDAVEITVGVAPRHRVVVPAP